MARHASTYRQYRRDRWAELRMSGSTLSWGQFNKQFAGEYGIVGNGQTQAKYVGTPAARSKYVPHIGAKQRAKGAK